MTHTPDIDEQINAAIRGMEGKMTVEAGADKEMIAHLITAAPEMLAVLEKLSSLLVDSEEYVPLEVREELTTAIKKARGERYCHSEYGSANCKWEPGRGCTPKCPECIPIGGEEMSHAPDIDEQVNAAIHGMTERMSVRTGGKWQLQRTPYESEIDIVSDGRVIATVEAGEGQEKVAQILVAAPDMLEALDNVYGGCWIDRDSYGPFVQKKITMEEYEAMGIAIKKARGEE